MGTVHSTTSVARRHRASYWQDAVCRTFVRLDCVLPRAASFSGRIDTSRIGEITLSDVKSTSLQVLRGTTEIRADPHDDFLVSVQVAGQCVLEQEGRVALLGPGDVALFDSRHPYSLSFSTAYRQLVMQMPRSLMTGCVPRAERATAIAFGSASPLTRLAAHTISDAARQDAAVTAEASGHLSSGLVQIVAALLAVHLPATRAHSPDQALLLQVKRSILSNLRNPMLDVGRIARLNAMQPRQLHQLFSSQEETVTRWMWNERLNASYRLLSKGGYRSITDVALLVGFSDACHFSRRFKARFGFPPSRLCVAEHAGQVGAAR